MYFITHLWCRLTQGSRVIAKVWSEITFVRGGAIQRGGATQIFAAPNFFASS